jgi:hypothetical protein
MNMVFTLLLFESNKLCYQPTRVGVVAINEFLIFHASLFCGEEDYEEEQGDLQASYFRKTYYFQISGCDKKKKKTHSSV